MDEAARQTRTHLIALFKEHGVHPRTMFGQNFLIDLNIVESIVRAADLEGRDGRDVVLEIGAGTGGMTTFLAAGAARVISVEIDNAMFAMAKQMTAGLDHVQMIHGDALRNKNNFSDELLETVSRTVAEVPDGRLKLVANLPYNVATPIISNLIASDLPWRKQVVTIQYELGLRLVAGPGSSHYGSLSVWAQANSHVKLLRKLPPTVFWPRPKVTSAVMRLDRNYKGQKTILDRVFFQDYQRRVFQPRRKLIRGVLAGMYRKQIGKEAVTDVLEHMGREANDRAEQLTVEEHIELGNALWLASEGQPLPPRDGAGDDVGDEVPSDDAPGDDAHDAPEAAAAASAEP